MCNKTKAAQQLKIIQINKISYHEQNAVCKLSITILTYVEQGQEIAPIPNNG